MDLQTMSIEDLTASLNESREKAKALFALDAPTVEQADEAVALVASIGEMEAEVTRRDEAVKAASERFAAARATFSGESAEDVEDEDADSEDEDAEDGDDSEDEDADPEDEGAEDGDDSEDGGEDAGDVVTAAAEIAGRRIKTSAAKRVGRKVKRPTAAAASPVTITAAADIPNVPMGSTLDDMSAVASAVAARVGGFAPYNPRAAQAAHSQSGGQPMLQKFAVASFGVNFSEEMRGGKGDADYNAMKASVKNHTDTLTAAMNAALAGKAPTAVDAITAAGWCAPSEVVYNWIADYVVDGLVTIPEISAPRGGLLLTEGPQLAQTTYGGDAVEDFGWDGTEAEAIAGDFNKVCETIECPDFVDHRLDFTGYCWKIPILTESAYPELIADALRLSDVFYAHKMNRRFINDIINSSTAVDASGYGGTFTDTLEALTQIAVKERRWWNVGENAMMEVKIPQEARDIFKFDMARRSGLALNDIATDQKIAAHFANHNLAVEYVSDFDERAGSGAATPDWSATIRAIIYPAGTYVKAVKDVINLSAVYDAASLTENEYTGVFFEQGVKTIKRGYRSHVVTVPVCTAGVTGANAFLCGEGSL